jgi:hypothetical protein
MLIVVLPSLAPELVTTSKRFGFPPFPARREVTTARKLSRAVIDVSAIFFR